MSEDCEVCQRHQAAFDAAADEAERRMLIMVWRHHDAIEDHRVHRYLDEGGNLAVTARL